MSYGKATADPTTAHDVRPLSHPWLRCALRLARPIQAGGAASVAVLSEEGYRQFRRHGHAHVASGCAPASVVRFVDERFADLVASADPEGCLALFHAPWPDLPVVLDSHVSGTTASLELRIPPDLRALRGHFASLPIVPGVIHVAWALHFARTELGVPAVLEGMDHVKFRRIVQPGLVLHLSVTKDRNHGGIAFRLGAAEEVFSSGRLLLEHGDD